MGIGPMIRKLARAVSAACKMQSNRFYAYTEGTASVFDDAMEVVMTAIRFAPTALFSALAVTVVVAGLSFTAPPAAAQEESMAPDITVREEEDRTVREYRVNGQLYAIEIQPAVGPSYYLVDENGDGDFRRSENANIAIPSWVLITW